VCGRGQRISENLNYILFFFSRAPPPPGCCAALSDPRVAVLQLVRRAAVQHRIAPYPYRSQGSYINTHHGTPFVNVVELKPLMGE
jgi:hypothetical protein